MTYFIRHVLLLLEVQIIPTARGKNFQAINGGKMGCNWNIGFCGHCISKTNSIETKIFIERNQSTAQPLMA